MHKTSSGKPNTNESIARRLKFILMSQHMQQNGLRMTSGCFFLQTAKKKTYTTIVKSHLRASKIFFQKHIYKRHFFAKKKCRVGTMHARVNVTTNVKTNVTSLLCTASDRGDLPDRLGLKDQKALHHKAEKARLVQLGFQAQRDLREDYPELLDRLDRLESRGVQARLVPEDLQE
jgi:hypothetical protein